jgi:hypothetical protein
MSVVTSPTRCAALWRGACALALGGVLLGAGGCSNLGQVNPWEKGNLAKPHMTFEGDPLDERFVQHIYTSKENASGGQGVGGGGCGCN